MLNNSELYNWQAVPAQVVKLLSVALAIKEAHIISAGDNIRLLDTATVTWQPAENLVAVYGTDLTKAAEHIYTQAYKSHMPSCVVAFLAPDVMPNPDYEILIKKAGIPFLTPFVDYTQKALGGPTPLTNALVGGLVAGGLGYGAGALAENLFPERYVERGKLRKTLGTLGLLGGAGFGTMNAYSNARANMPTDKFLQAPVANTMRGFLMRNDRPPTGTATGGKTAAFNSSGFASGSLNTPFIPVQQFNQAVWRDTQKGMSNGFATHTPPAYAAATTGFMTGLSAGNRSSIISPMDIIHGIASAGVGLATANIAGRTLSALAGLTPAGQNTLQDMGLWGGMMHAIVPSMMGFRR